MAGQGGDDEQDFDVLAVGDIVTDAFIRLLDDEAHTYYNEEGQWLAIPYSTKIPFESAEVVAGVGNAPNAAVSFARQGLRSGLITNIGEDQNGQDMIKSLHHNKVDTRFVKINPDKTSNYHYVLWYKEDRTILIKHEEYRYHWPHLRRDEIPQWIYFSSVSANSQKYHDEIADWLEEHPEVRLAFQPGTFQMEAGVKKMKRIYQRTEVVTLNREEAAFVSGGELSDIHNLFDKMHELGPKIVVITDGPKGAYASGPEGRYKMPLYPDPKPPLERTGAGDSFSSTFVAQLIKGSNIEGALQMAPINSMNVVQYVGAQRGLLDEEHLESLLRIAPHWYKPEKI